MHTSGSSSRVASLKGCYGATARACREYHERFEIDKTTIGDLNAYRRSDEYRKRVAKLRKSIKNARDEWRARNFAGHKFWARGYFVSTVGRDEEMIRAYIKNQEMQDRELDQLSMIP